MGCCVMRKIGKILVSLLVVALLAGGLSVGHTEEGLGEKSITDKAIIVAKLQAVLDEALAKQRPIPDENDLADLR